MAGDGSDALTLVVAPSECEAGKLRRAVESRLERGEVSKAQQHLEGALQSVQSAGDKRAEAVVQELFGQLHLLCERIPEALEACRASIALFQTCGELEDAGRVSQTLAEAAATQDLPCCDSVRKELTDLREAVAREDHILAEAFVLMALCIISFPLEKYEDCLDYARESAELFEAQSGRQAEEAQALTLLAEVRLALGAGPSFARRAAEKAMRLLQAKTTSSNRADLLLRASLAALRARVASQSELPAHVNTATAWAGHLTAAQECEALARATGDLQAAAATLCEAAKVQSATGRHQAACRSAASAARLYREHGVSADVLQALTLAADAARQTGRDKDQQRFGSELHELALELGDTSAEAKANELLQMCEAVQAKDGHQSVPSSLALPEPAETSLEQILMKVMDVDLSFTPGPRMPIMKDGKGKNIFKPMSHDEFLSLGRKNEQGAATFELLSLSSEKTASSRPARMDYDPDVGQRRRRPRPAQESDQAGAQGAAPVRKRMDSQLRWRPPEPSKSISLSSLPRRRKNLLGGAGAGIFDSASSSVSAVAVSASAAALAAA